MKDNLKDRIALFIIGFSCGLIVAAIVLVSSR